MPLNRFGESLFIVIDVVLDLCKSFTKGSLFIIQGVIALCFRETPYFGCIIWDLGQQIPTYLAASDLVQVQPQGRVMG